MEVVDGSGHVLQVFGGMGLQGAAGPISVGGGRQRRLLALLAIRTNTVVDIDWLVEYLWTDADRPDAPAPALRTYVSRLRQAFPEEIRGWLETEPSGYRLSAPEGAVEHTRFRLLRSQARAARERADPLTAQRLLDEALGLWRGKPFRELEDLDWARAEVERLSLDRLEVLEERWEAALALGRHTQITGELAVFTAEHGLRERAARQYALALHRSGRTAEALRIIEDHRKVIADVSGLEPSAAIVELEDALLSGDPSLEIEDTGTPLRGYRLLEQIGTGAFSIVWRGIQPSIDREVAIKQIRSELASQREFIRRFEAEAHLVARIEHPHIVPLIDYWRDPDSAYLVMRWLRGGTLERRLDDGPISLDETLTMARQIGGALSVAHDRGVVHRDVKAANILFDEQQNAFLSDFGIALEVTESGGPEAALTPGSPAYAAPEQIRREQLGPESDMFSLGVVIYECLTGSLPFRDSSSAEELIHRQLNDPYPPLLEVDPGIPPEVSAAVSRATAKNPADRFATVDEFLAALEPRELIVEVGRTTATRTEIANPYMGLRSFDDGDTARFFGRERLVSELVGRLSGNTIASRCLVVVGPSGSGKSSVVRAGLTPAIRSGAVPGSEAWFVTTMVPGTDPFESLEAALLRIAVNPPASLLGQLRDGERGLLRGLRRSVGSDDARVLLVIDQFEELFAGPAADVADGLLDALAVAVEDPTSPLRLVVTLRADYYDRPLQHPTFAPVLKETAVEVTPLAPDELERAIVEPARREGVEFESGLVPRIVAETVRQPSPLPMLQYMLAELFDRRSGNRMTAADYAELGGLSGALAARAEAVYSAGTGTQKAATRTVFGRLTDPSTADLRRRIIISDLGEDPDVAWVLDRFGSARLFSYDRDPASREPTVEVAHEALLREWPRLVGWLSEDRELLLSADAMALATDAWVAAGRQRTDLYRGARLERASELASTAPERLRTVDLAFVDASNAAAEVDRRLEEARVTRLRRLVTGVAVALVVALVAGGIALVQRGRALDAVAEAELQTIVARSAALTREQPDVSLLLALEAARRQPGPTSEQAVLNALGSTTQHRIASFPSLTNAADGCAPHPPLFTVDVTREFKVAAGRLVSRDLLTGAITDHGESPLDCAAWFGNPEVDRWFLTSNPPGPPGQHQFGDFGRSWDAPIDLASETYPAFNDFTPGGVAVFFYAPDVLQPVDATGRPIGEPVEAGGTGLGVVSPDGAHIAIPFPDFETLVNWILILDGETGEEKFRVDLGSLAGLGSQSGPPALAFDATGDELVAVLLDGTMRTIDVGRGNVVAEVTTGITSDVVGAGIRSDGLVIVVSEGSIELVDRRTGPTGVSVPLRRDVAAAALRPDERIAVWRHDGSVDIYDLEPTNALIETMWDVEDPFTETAFNDGIAGGVNRQTGLFDTVDLTTGSRTSVQLRTADGDLFEAVKAYPEEDGVTAIDGHTTYARFEADTMVESVPLNGVAYTGTRLFDIWAVLVEGEDGTYGVRVLDVRPGQAEILLSLDFGDFLESVHPTPDGGVHIGLEGGRLQTYGPEGDLLGEVHLGETTGNIITLDPGSGRLAVMLESGGVAIIDPTTGDIGRVPMTDRVGNLGFGPDGEYLAITQFDGLVRLWDVERNQSAGLVWEGEGGAVVASPSWYDPDSESMWIFATGRLLQVPMNPDRWIGKACEIVDRDLTPAEWDRHVPGDGPPESACG